MEWGGEWEIGVGEGGNLYLITGKRDLNCISFLLLP